MYFTANPNGEAEIIKITLDASVQVTNPRMSIFLERNFANILIKGRAARGNVITKKPIHRIGLKSHGHSTLGGRKVWFDPDVNRINYEEHGCFLGEFNDGESILVVLKNGEFYLSNFDANNHYEDNILLIEKFDEQKVWTAVLYDADNQGYPYVKRFYMEASKKHQNFLGDNPESRLVILSEQVYPRLNVMFGGDDSSRPPMEIDVEQFIGVKGFKAKGKRISTWQIDHIEELEPLRFPEPEQDADDDSDLSESSADTSSVEEDLDPDAGKSQQQVIDEMTGQLSLFPDDV
jgi:topoisomerase-4 subunit A